MSNAPCLFCGQITDAAFCVCPGCQLKHPEPTTPNKSHMEYVRAEIKADQEPCEHEWQWHTNPGTPDGPSEHIKSCKNCGMEFPGSDCELARLLTIDEPQLPHGVIKARAVADSPSNNAQSPENQSSSIPGGAKIMSLYEILNSPKATEERRRDLERWEDAAFKRARISAALSTANLAKPRPVGFSDAELQFPLFAENPFGQSLAANASPIPRPAPGHDGVNNLPLEKQMPNKTTTDVPKCPACNWASLVRDKANTALAFFEFLQEHKIILDLDQSDLKLLEGQKPNNLIDEFLGIDRLAMEDERRALLEWQRKRNND